MDRKRATEPRDSTPDVKVVLSGLWISTMFVFVYVDVLGSLRADRITAALEGRISGTGIEINQRFLILVTIFAIIPSLMISVSLLTRARINRIINIIVSLAYVAAAGASIIGEKWIYYIIGTIVEIVLWLTIARVAWTWPRHPTQ